MGDASTVCRAAAGDCDVAETCSGTSASCPSDKFHAATVQCRASAGACDVAEMCTGTSAACPGNSFLPPSTICRVPKGPCDAPEHCSGTSADCPPDAFFSSSHQCQWREDLCSRDAFCTGSSASCAGGHAPAGTICRASVDACDVAERCTGESGECPPDIRTDRGFSYRCGSACFACGVKFQNFTLDNGSYKLGGCSMGSCTSFTALPYPACLDSCVEGECSNGQPLAVMDVFSCNRFSTRWICNYEAETAEEGETCPAWIIE